MEQPTLFYAVALVIAFTGTGNGMNAWIAWGYVGLRIVHSLVAGDDQPGLDPLHAVRLVDPVPDRADAARGDGGVRMAYMAEKFERHRQPWRQDEIQKLHTLAKKGMALKAIAKALTRSEESVKQRAKEDGLSIAKAALTVDWRRHYHRNPREAPVERDQCHKVRPMLGAAWPGGPAARPLDRGPVEPLQQPRRPREAGAASPASGAAEPGADRRHEPHLRPIEDVAGQIPLHRLLHQPFALPAAHPHADAAASRQIRPGDGRAAARAPPGSTAMLVRSTLVRMSPGSQICDVGILRAVERVARRRVAHRRDIAILGAMPAERAPRRRRLNRAARAARASSRRPTRA